MNKTIASGISALALVAFAFAGTSAVAATTEPATLADTSKGNAWVDGKGMTLYTFDQDQVGKSNCTGECATAWPPLSVQAGAEAAGDWTIIVRADGAKQWAHEGKPLYTWIKDKKPGDVTGDGVNGFHLAQ